MNFEEIIMPATVAEAYHALVTRENPVVIGGGGFIKLQKRRVTTAIDLSRCGLDAIHLTPENIEVGAMVTLRTIETHEEMPRALKTAMRNIVGVALRNLVTVGGSVMGKYGFSDVITPLLALDTHLEFHSKGRMSLEKFLQSQDRTPDILVKLIVPRAAHSAFYNLQLTYTDFSMVNLAIAKNHHLRIAVGARPGVARLLKDPNLHLSPQEILEPLKFADDDKASGEYRRALAETLLADALKEVAQWK
ncbi:MAG: hypothetical protein AVO33_01520 [delta proteobacterium ML8_F1]|nr:MAG: hypothetical protein AVO33_01520 [delta proteobacterium ML8_F1]